MNAAIVSLAVSTLAAALGTSSANVALPTFAAAFSASFRAVQWIVVGYLLSITIAIVPLGRLGDLAGRRRVLRASLVAYLAASLACAAATSLAWLVVARALQGISAAGMMALSLAFASDVASPRRTGTAMGILAATSSFGTALGPSLGGLLLASFGWRGIFVVHAAIGALGFALAGTLPEARGARRLPLPARLLRDVGGALVATTLVSCVVMTSMVVGPFYLTIALGLDATRTGLVMSIGSVVAALTGVPAGRLVDRVGAKPATLVGLAGMSAGALAFSLRPEHLGVAGYVAPMAALTASYALFTAANNTGVMQRASASERGVASGTLSLARNAGLVAGACVMGAAFAFGAGVPDVALASAHAVARGLRTTYALAAVLVALAFAVVSLTKGERS